MLAPTSTEFGYSPPMYSAAPAGGSGERPKLFMVEAQAPQMAMAMHGYESYQAAAAQTPQHQMTPQHAHQAQMHEPLMMSSMGYYPPLLGAGAAAIVHTPQHQAQTPQHQHMLHVSADYEYANAVVTPGGSTSSKSGTKRSREDLNLKEKKRMFKLNDRINQLKEMLDEAGVQTKKNKQSVLDNASHYIDMLRSNLLIAKQKAERAEKQAEAFRAQAQAQRGGAGGDKLLRGVFQKTTTPRVVVDLHMQPVTVNAAFVAHTGQPEAALLKKKEALRRFLCADAEALDEIVKRVSREKKTATVVVQAAAAGADDATQQVTLVASAVTSDDGGKTTNIEFSLLPAVEQLQPKPEQASRADADAETSSEDL